MENVVQRTVSITPTIVPVEDEFRSAILVWLRGNESIIDQKCDERIIHTFVSRSIKRNACCEERAFGLSVVFEGVWREVCQTAAIRR